MLVIQTMIRHASPSGPITAISGGMHDATARSCLIASPSFPLSVASGFLRARFRRSRSDLDRTACRQGPESGSEHTETFCKMLRRQNETHRPPQPRRRFRLLQPPIRSSMPPCSKLSRRGLETSECASLAERRPTLTASARDGARNLRSGRKKACGAVEQKKDAGPHPAGDCQPGGRPRHRVTAPSLRGFRQPFTHRHKNSYAVPPEGCDGRYRPIGFQPIVTELILQKFGPTRQ